MNKLSLYLDVLRLWLIVVAIIALLLLLFAPKVLIAQPNTLPRVIEQTLSQSAAGRQAATNRDISQWQYRAFRADYRPQLALEGVVPNYSRTITPVTQPDGTTDFRYVRISNAYLATTLTQGIALTGGSVSVGSTLQRFDNLEAGQRLYSSNPVAVGLTQPIGGYNALRWNRRIEPLRYQEAGRLYAEERETIAGRVTELYFDVLLQQVNADVARQNRQASQELLRLGRERHRLGRLSENELLLLELNLLAARQAEVQAGIEARSAAVLLQGYTGLALDPVAPLAVPAAAPAPAVSPEAALTQARQHRREELLFRRRLLEADRDVAKARGSTGFQANLTATFGLASSGDQLGPSYLNPNNQQQLRLGFAVPLVDWGRTRATRTIAELSRQQTQRTVAQEQQTFDQAVLTQAAQLGALHEQQALTARVDSLAQRRYDIAQATYKVGRISLTDLGIAQSEKDRARRAYVAALRACWVAYYQLRALTLWDFERGVALGDAEEESVLGHK